MNISRRQFFGIASALTIASGTVVTNAYTTHDIRKPKAPPDPYGCLVDLTACVGCRTCEQACNKVNDLPPPTERLDDRTVFDKKRRPHEGAFTVVNRYYSGRLNEQNELIPTYVKVQCMHCQDPACVSACIAGALQKRANGAVVYDQHRCIGCRYCMIACPFGIPAYEYYNPISPRVRKCFFCYERISHPNGKPGCAAACPMEAITFGKRRDILEIAHQKIKNNPVRYMDKIYGEFEMGGTSWLYLSKDPFEKLGFLKLQSLPAPHYTESIQHTIFSYLWAPITLFTILTGVMWKLNPKQITHGSDIHAEEDIK